MAQKLTPIEVKRSDAAIQRDIANNVRPKFYNRTYLETLNGLTMDEYSRKYKGRIKNANEHDRFFRVVIPAGTTVAAGTYNLFHAAKTSSIPNIANTSYTLDDADTNMVEANQMEFGNWLLVESFQVQCIATTREFNAFSSGKPTDLTPAAAGTISASNTIAGIANEFFIEWKVGGNVKASGPLIKYPTEYVMSGAFGGDTDEGFAQIGMGKARPLRELVILQPKQNFTVQLKVLRAMICPQDVIIRVFLSGTLLEDVG